MTKTLIDAADVTRRALYGMDDGWYDAYWCRERPPAKPHLLIRVTRCLAIARGAAVARHLRWPARRHTPAATHPCADDLVEAGEG
jgi:hypothetical protein